MSTPARIGVFAAIAVAAVGAYFAFSGGSSQKGASTTRVTATTPVLKVVRATVPINADGPVGGVRTIVASAGDRLVITVKSNGYAGEVHLHGFNIKREVSAHGKAVFNLSSHDTSAPSAVGVVEMELEDIAAQIAKLEIRPS